MFKIYNCSISPYDFIFNVYKKTMTEEEKQQVKHQFIKSINKYMKRIGKEIGYDKPLKTYAARHSFATVIKRSGALSDLPLKHLDKSLQTTEAYLISFEDESRMKFMNNLVPM